MPLPDISQLTNGTSILFLGAGFSAEATNVHGHAVKDVAGLIEYLLEEIGEPSAEGYDLDSAAEEYQKNYGNEGEEKLTVALHSNFRSIAQTENQKTIVCQPWYRIYTTNYDDVVENICSLEKKPITTKEVTDPVSPPIPDTTQLIHIYGNITRASADEFRRHFLLTESQRDNSPFLKSPWMRRFHDDVLTASSIVFVGFSLNDIDIRRLLGSLPREVLSKVHFITRTSTKKPILTRMNKYGTAHPIDLGAFAAHLGARRTGPAIKTYSAMPMALQEIEFNPAVKTSISSKDIEKLMISGDIDVFKLSEADLSGAAGAYTITRSQHAYARISKYSSGEKPILVHGDIGNGKTVFAYQVAYLFRQKNYRVFRVMREPENSGEILRYLQSLETPTLVMFDDFMRFSTLPSAIIEMNRKNITVLATVRTIVVDTAHDRIRARLGNATPIEIDLNTPLREETLRIVRYLDENGLWGEHSDMADGEKLNFIERKCGGQLRDVVLSLYQTGSLHKQVEDLLLNIQDLDKSSRDVIALSALLSYADFEQLCRFSDISELVDYSGVLEELRATLAQHQLGTLVRLDMGDVAIRSPALAQFILARVFGLEAVLDMVKPALFILDKYYRDDSDFIKLGKALLKFSLYGPLVKGKRENEVIEKFYSDCRTLSFAKNDPLFWVQRSICNMHDRQFDISHRFVDTAYGLAGKMKSFDTYQIDNHYARLLLTQSLEEGVSPDGKREQEAQSLLQAALARKSSELYHPLSVMRLYAELVDKWHHALSESQKAALKKAIDEAVKTIGTFRHGGRFRNLPDLQRRLAEASKRLSS